MQRCDVYMYSNIVYIRNPQQLTLVIFVIITITVDIYMHDLIVNRATVQPT